MIILLLYEPEKDGEERWMFDSLKPGEHSYRDGCCKRVPDRTRTPMIYAYQLGTKSLLCDEVYWLARSLDLMSISVVISLSN